MAATAGVGCQVDLTVWGQLCALSRVPQSPLSAPVPPLPLMSAAGQSSMSPSPAASMIGPLMRPNVMTVFAVVFTMPIVSGPTRRALSAGFRLVAPFHPRAV